MGLRNYALVTAGYWAFTISDGALRMLVLLYFHDLGYSPVAIAFLFLLYEVMGIATNLIGGWLGARSGLQRTLYAGLALQVVALVGLSFHDPGWVEAWSVAFVMGLQALSGIAKDLTKMSSKSAVKFVAGEGALFRMVAVLTGSKNALKGLGFFVGAALLDGFGYDTALYMLAALVGAALVAVLVLLDEPIGRAKRKPRLRSILSKSDAINRLSLARLFLFGSRDIWFVVALPVFLDEGLGWSFSGIGGFLACWIIGYGVVQSLAPTLVRRARDDVRAAQAAAAALLATSLVLAIGVTAATGTALEATIVGGLVVFGIVFAINSSLHSFLVLAYSASDDDVALDVGFYYSANATGRLVGTLLSGVLYLWGGLELAMWGSTAFVAITWLLSFRLPPLPSATTTTGRSEDGKHAAI